MPIYMDLHIVPNVTARAVAEAHREDLKIQDEYGCRCMTYWIDEQRGSVFCLIEAPDKESVSKMHGQAHGLIPHEIIQVNQNVVEDFLGRIQDPENFETLSDPDLKIFNDPSFRTILVTESTDFRLLQNSLGKNKTTELFSLYNQIAHDQIRIHDGRKVELSGESIIGSFLSVNQAVSCALAIQKALHIAAEILDLRIGVHAGLPVGKHDRLFGSTIKFAKYLCGIGQKNQVLISSLVRELYQGDYQGEVGNEKKLRWLSATDENFLERIMNTLENSWHDSQFSMDDFCRVMAMSKSNLYRKCVSITGKSPNSLLQDFRLLQSLYLLRKQDRNIAQTTFDTGFSSPSYFGKCFQKKFGLQPLAYLKA
jgi:AraC-like DNA-binding protein